MGTAIAAGICINGHCEADIAQGSSRQPTQIPAEDLDVALRKIESERALEVIFLTEDVRGIRTNGARGNLTPDETLNKLLRGTGLAYQWLDRNTVTIVPAHAAAEDGHAGGRQSDGNRPSQQLERFDEVVVTAQKRAEYLQDVPVSVSVIGGPGLEEWGATRLTDFAAYLPGVSVVPGPASGEDMLILRGLSLPSQSTLVGTYIDDTPISASSAQQPTMRRALDLLPYDFERVEVLKGPQGTLYGANAMGGLIKYVTVAPDLRNVTARIGVDLKENDNASEAGWNARASLNMPIAADKAALRVSLSQDFTPGFISEPGQGRTDGNQAKEQAGRLALLLKPSDPWSIQLAVLAQHLDSPDPGAITLTTALRPDAGPLANSEQVPQTFESRLAYYSAAINGDLHWASIASATSYSSVRWSSWAQAYYPLNLLSGRAATGFDLSSDKLTEELRLASRGGGRLQWLAGAFFTHERGDQLQSGYALDAVNAVIANPRFNPAALARVPSRYREYALFANATWKLGDAVDLAAGLRESRNEQSFGGRVSCSSSYVSMIGPCPPSGSGASQQSVFNFSIGPSFHFSRDVMGYLRVASGYRPGGPNVPGSGIPRSVAADNLISSELGIKSAWFDRRLRLEATVYQIDWRHIQVLVEAPPPESVTYGANGNTATVRGFEAATVLAPVANLRLGANATYTNAVLSTPMPSGSTLVGNRGDRLPYIPLWSGSATADYTYPLRRDWAAMLGARWGYTGQRYTTINNVDNCPLNCAGTQRVPSLRPYGTVDLHAGISDGKSDVRFTVRNFTNKYALVDVYGSIGQTFDPAPVFATVLPGRLFTLSLDRRF